MTASYMKFIALKLGFYSPPDTEAVSSLLDGAYDKLQTRFKLDRIFDWFVPRSIPVDPVETNWTVIARTVADDLLEKATRAGMKAIKCGDLTYRLPWPPFDSSKALTIMAEHLAPWAPDADPMSTEGITFRDAIKAGLTKVFDLFSHDGDPKVHCEFIAGKWVDTVEFLLHDGALGDPHWFVTNPQGKVIFTASISYECPC